LGAPSKERGCAVRFQILQRIHDDPAGRDAREQRRDTVTSDGIGHMNADRSWTDRSRQVEGRSRPPDERREQ
jgi:hypothetical protein